MPIDRLTQDCGNPTIVFEIQTCHSGESDGTVHEVIEEDITIRLRITGHEQQKRAVTHTITCNNTERL